MKEPNSAQIPLGIPDTPDTAAANKVILRGLRDIYHSHNKTVALRKEKSLASVYKAKEGAEAFVEANQGRFDDDAATAFVTAIEEEALLLLVPINDTDEAVKLFAE